MKRFLPTLLLLSGLPLLSSAYSAELVVNTAGENINAIEGVVHVPAGVDIDALETGRSAILIWVKPPVFDRESRAVSFSGISPGGFQGAQPLFSFSGTFAESDLPNFTYSEVRALKNDGEGTSAGVLLSLNTATEVTDDAPPEPFVPIISSSPDIFEGRSFVSFLAQDKGAGVSYYEYDSTWLLRPNEGNWVRVQSPLPLSSLEKFKRIHIRAVDYEGNVRKVSTAGEYRYVALIFAIIILSCALSFSIRSFRLHSSRPY